MDANTLWALAERFFDIIITAGAVIFAITRLGDPVKSAKKKAKEEGREEAAAEQEMKTLRGWTSAQQEDLDALAQSDMVVITAVVAILNRLIEQGANGECTRARDALLAHMAARGVQNKSHK